MSEKEVVRCLRSRKSGYEMPAKSRGPLFTCLSLIPTSSEDLRKSNGLSSAAFTTLKIVVLSPMPMARHTTASAVKAGALRSERAA